MPHTKSHDEYIERLHKLAEHIKAHPEEARAGVAKLSEAAQKPAGEIIKVFVSDKDDKAKYEEVQAIKAKLPASVVAEIENHKTQLAHKIGLLTLDEIVARLEAFAVVIKEHPEEARAGVAKLSEAAQKPAGEILKVFVSDKTPKEKHAEIQKIREGLPSAVLGEIDAHKEALAKRLRITPLHKLSHIPAHDDYIDKLHRLADHIKAHPEEAKAGIAKLSAAAQGPAGEIVKIFVSDKDALAKINEIQKIKAGLPDAVKAEIENHKTQLAHKIGILTLKEIVARLEVLAEHIKAHPEEAKAKLATLSPAAQEPAAHIIKIFLSDKTPREKHNEILAYQDTLAPEVLGEILARKEALAHRLRIAPLHHLGVTQSAIDYADKVHRLVEHIKAHPDEARAGVAKLSAEAQKPAGEIVKIFVSDKDIFAKLIEIEKIKSGLSLAVKTEIENHKTELAHKIGILTIAEIVERLEKLADHIKAHPEEAKAKIASSLSPAAQKPFGEMVKIFVSDKTPREKWAECKAIKDALPLEIQGEINALKEELAHKIGTSPVHSH